MVRNVHFTDVMDGDEMIFDYRLRDGVVKTSNALRLLGMAGIAVPDDDRVDSPLSADPRPSWRASLRPRISPGQRGTLLV
jgi:hypothetical protein